MNDNKIFKRIEEIKSEKLIISKAEAYKKIISVIDLTTLEGCDTNKKIIEVCEKAVSFSKQDADIPNVAAVCFYPPFVRLAKSKLEDTSVNVACVATAFPSGQSPLHIKLAEVKYVVDEGADEVDMVISRGKFLEGEYNFVYDEIAAVKQACKNAHLKVILETGELENHENIRKASEIAISAGADFIKTSTGKINPAATEDAFLIMLEVIKEHYEKTNKMIGIKPAGGISEPEQALDYLNILEKTLGEKWMNNKFFRIGASRLAAKVFAKIAH